MLTGIPTRNLGRTGLRVTTLGFGAAPLGNLYEPVADAAALATVSAALETGINYFDTAPFYGYGLSERRVGDALRGRTDYVLSTKVGRLLEPVARGKRVEHGFKSPMPFSPRFDYSYAGIMRSYEDSLQRLGLAHIDILLVHDIGSMTHGTDASRHFAALMTDGGYDALAELRRRGDIKAIGLGVNEAEICEQVMDRAHFDCFLLAGRYTLLEQAPLKSFLPKCISQGISIILGGPYNSGILATGTRCATVPYYNYAAAPPAVVERVAEIEVVCDQFGVSLPAAALQFPLAHPAVVSVIPGLRGPGDISHTLDSFNEQIPDEFWEELKDRELLDESAPVPGMQA